MTNPYRRTYGICNFEIAIKYWDSSFGNLSQQKYGHRHVVGGNGVRTRHGLETDLILFLSSVCNLFRTSIPYFESAVFLTFITKTFEL